MVPPSHLPKVLPLPSPTRPRSAPTSLTASSASPTLSVTSGYHVDHQWHKILSVRWAIWLDTSWLGAMENISCLECRNADFLKWQQKQTCGNAVLRTAVSSKMSHLATRLSQTRSFVTNAEGTKVEVSPRSYVMDTDSMLCPANGSFVICRFPRVRILGIQNSKLSCVSVFFRLGRRLLQDVRRGLRYRV